MADLKFLGQKDNNISFEVLKFCTITGLGILWPVIEIAFHGMYYKTWQLRETCRLFNSSFVIGHERSVKVSYRIFKYM